jgi:hypothetical protein
MSPNATPADQITALALCLEDLSKLYARIADAIAPTIGREVAEVSGHIWAAHAAAIRESVAVGNTEPLMELADIVTEWHLNRVALPPGTALCGLAKRK